MTFPEEFVVSFPELVNPVQLAVARVSPPVVIETPPPKVEVPIVLLATIIGPEKVEVAPSPNIVVVETPPMVNLDIIETNVVEAFNVVIDDVAKIVPVLSTPENVEDPNPIAPWIN